MQLDLTGTHGRPPLCQGVFESHVLIYLGAHKRRRPTFLSMANAHAALAAPVSIAISIAFAIAGIAVRRRASTPSRISMGSSSCSAVRDPLQGSVELSAVKSSKPEAQLADFNTVGRRWKKQRQKGQLGRLYSPQVSTGFGYSARTSVFGFVPALQRASR